MKKIQVNFLVLVLDRVILGTSGYFDKVSSPLVTECIRKRADAVKSLFGPDGKTSFLLPTPASSDISKGVTNRPA